MAVCFPAISLSPSFLPPSVVVAIRKRRRLKSAVKLGSDGDVTQYVTESRKHWDSFYERHQNKFFKDRHYLEKDWGHYFCDENDTLPSNGKVILEAGCGTGNTIIPLTKKFPQLFVHACDFSQHAVTLVKSHTNFHEDQMNVFVCNIAEDNLCDHITPASVDIVTLVFTLSAVSPEKMPIVLHNIGRVLKPNGYVLLRDYAIGDYAQAMLMNKNRVISENFYFCGDVTCSFYFSEDLLSELFVCAGFTVVDVNTYNREIENRAKNITMQRGYPTEFASYFHYSRSLRFDDKPDYAYLKRIFRGLFIREGFQFDYIFDWTIFKYQQSQLANPPILTGKVIDSRQIVEMEAK